MTETAKAKGHWYYYRRCSKAMTRWTGILARAAVSGTAASIASTAVLGLVARAEGKAPFQPLNATSHWLNGDRAAEFKGVDLAHTAVGYATHHAATIFWALFFERWIATRPALSPASIAQRALALSAIAAAVDYGPTPKRFTPGWELVLSKRSMAAVYGAMAAGLAAGTLMLPRRRV